MGLISDEGGPGFAGAESEPCHGLQGFGASRGSRPRLAHRCVPHHWPHAARAIKGEVCREERAVLLGFLLVLRYLLLSAAFLFVVIYWAEYNCVYFILACGISLAVLLNLVVFQSEGLLSFSQSPSLGLGGVLG